MAADLPEMRITVKFTIEKTGWLDKVQLLDDGGYPKVAARIVELLSQSPRWCPGTCCIKPMRTVLTIPFIINKKTN